MFYVITLDHSGTGVWFGLSFFVLVLFLSGPFLCIVRML